MYSYFVIFLYLIILLSANIGFAFLWGFTHEEGVNVVFDLVTPLSYSFPLLTDFKGLFWDTIF